MLKSNKVILSSLLVVALVFSGMNSQADEKVDGSEGDATGESTAASTQNLESKSTVSATSKQLPAAAQFLIVEGLLVVNAGIAAESPEGYGSVMLVLTPLLAFPKKRHEAVFFSLALGLFLYDIIVPSKSDLTKEEIFIQNIAAWNGILLVNLAVESLFGEEKSSREPTKKSDASFEIHEQRDRPQFQVGFAPLPNGASLYAKYQF